MKNEKNVLSFLSFFALLIVAILIFVNKLLPIVGINVGGSLFDILSTIKEVFILIVVGISAYSFVANKNKTWKIVFWVAILLFVAGVVLIWF